MVLLSTQHASARECEAHMSTALVRSRSYPTHVWDPSDCQAALCPLHMHFHVKHERFSTKTMKARHFRQSSLWQRTVAADKRCVVGIQATEGRETYH